MIDLNLKKSCEYISLKPFSYITPSISSKSAAMISLLCLQALMLIITKSYNSLAILLASTVASTASESVYYFVGKKNGPVIHTWRISIIQGLILGLFIPSGYPIPAVFCISFFTLLAGKYFFGEFSDSWTNMVAFAVVVMYMVNNACFSDYSVTVSQLQSRNPSLQLIKNGSIPILSQDAAITEFLNTRFFKILGVSIPEGYVSFFWDNGSAIPAFRFNLLTLFSSLVLLSMNMVDYIIPAVFLFFYAVFIRFIIPLTINGTPMQGDILLAFLTSGTLFATLYLLQWYGTTPVTFTGKISYGFIASVLALYVVGGGTSAIGFAFLTLLMNMISPLIQVAEDQIMYKRTARHFFAKLREIKEVQ